MNKMKIKRMDFDFSVCKIENFSLVNFANEYIFIGKTDEENSLVCITDDIPENVLQRDDGWKALEILSSEGYEVI